MSMKRMEFDLGSLTWIKEELDGALQAARQTLADWNGSETTPLRNAATHLHQVYGALQIVDLRGLSLLTTETECLLADMGERAELREAGRTTALSAIAAIQSYLDELVGGDADSEMRLSPLYREIVTLRGGEAPALSALFYPDLQVRAARPETELPMDEAGRGLAIRRARSQYQKGLLLFLQERGADAGLTLMEEAVQAITRVAPGPTYTFWWSVAGLMERLRDTPADAALKRLCGRIDAQMRRLVEGSSQLAESLFREVLYHLAQDDKPDGRAAAVRSLFQLHRYLPQQQNADPTTAHLPHLNSLHDSLAVAMDNWVSFCAGGGESLGAFQHAALALFESSARLPNGAMQTLARIIQSVAKRLPGAADTARNETLQLEMATALLLAQNGVYHIEHLGAEFQQQSDAQAMRLQAAIDPSFDLSRIPRVTTLDEYSRAAQGKLVLAQVTREIQANLDQIEEILDPFFRDPDQRGGLPMVPALMKQIVGALNILQLDVAARLVGEASRRIAYFSESDARITQEMLDWAAEALSYLGIYLEALRHGRDDSNFLKTLLGRSLSGSEPAGLVAPAPLPVAAASPSGDLDTQLLPIFLEEAAGLLPRIGAALRAWRAAPGAAPPCEALKRALHNLKGAARMAGAMDLGEIVHALEGEVGECGAASVAAARLDSLEVGYDRIADRIEHYEQVRNDARADDVQRPTGDLHQALRHIRKVPIASLEERLHRLARQAARETGRRLRLEIEGGQTQIGRTLLDKITAPLEHLVRNAVAHGIEDPKVRAAAGKPESGLISLAARQVGEEIELILSDDGQGIDHAAVHARALALGWLTADEPASDAQLEALLFRSGFSTAAEVTQLAGRGIGLDVVQSEIAEIGGRVRLESDAGIGTHFTLLLPLSLA